MILKILNLFKKKKIIITSFQKYKNYFEKKDSTFMLSNSSIRFDVADKIENRKYVKI